MPDKVEKKRTRFSYHAPHAEEVSLAGSFNGWNTSACLMKRDKQGNWSITLDLYPGQYEYKFLVDSKWVIDPNCTRFRINEYGEYDCRLTVE